MATLQQEVHDLEVSLGITNPADLPMDLVNVLADFTHGLSRGGGVIGHLAQASGVVSLVGDATCCEATQRLAGPSASLTMRRQRRPSLDHRTVGLPDGTARSYVLFCRCSLPHGQVPILSSHCATKRTYLLHTSSFLFHIYRFMVPQAGNHNFACFWQFCLLGSYCLGLCCRCSVSGCSYFRMPLTVPGLALSLWSL
jgi:hypothetical protein